MSVHAKGIYTRREWTVRARWNLLAVDTSIFAESIHCLDHTSPTASLCPPCLSATVRFDGDSGWNVFKGRLSTGLIFSYHKTSPGGHSLKLR